MYRANTKKTVKLIIKSRFKKSSTNRVKTQFNIATQPKLIVDNSLKNLKIMKMRLDKNKRKEITNILNSKQNSNQIKALRAFNHSKRQLLIGVRRTLKRIQKGKIK